MMHAKRWAGRVLLVGFGVFAALAVLEGLLRLGGLLVRPPTATFGAAARPGAGRYRVLCLGESTTAGMASGARAYPYQLEEILNERAAGRASFEVINGGMPGTTTDVIVAELPGQIERLEPNIVVTMMGINDGRLIEPAFQVGGSLRVWKLAKMLYQMRRPPPAAERAEELLVRAKAALQYWPQTAAELAGQAVQLVPDDLRGHIIVAEAGVRRNEIESAAAAYRRAMEIDGLALLAYSFEVDEAFIRVLDWVLSRQPRDADALAARSVLAMRRRELTGAEYYARRATEIDPRHVVAMLLHGRALQLAGMAAEARVRFAAALAINPRLVRMLASDPVVASPELVQLAVAAEEVASGTPPPMTSFESWFLRAREDFEYRLNGLLLQETWERIADGEADDATDSLQALAEPGDEAELGVQLRAHGQLAVLAWQNGDAAQAEEQHGVVEDFLENWVNAATVENYRRLSETLRANDIQLVAVQYPMRRLAPLQRLLESPADVVFVDNERVFKDALLGRPYTEIFYDLFAGDFGHLTVEGNRILADNVAAAVLELVPEMRGDRGEDLSADAGNPVR